MAEDIFANDPVLTGLDSSQDEDIFANDPVLNELQEIEEPAPVDFGRDPILQSIDADLAENEVDYQNLLTIGDKPEEDVPEAGFLSGLKSGAVGTFSSAIGVPAELINDAIAGYAQENFPDTDFAKWTQEAAEAQKLRQANRQEYVRKLPATQTLQRLQEAESVDEYVDTFLESPEKWNTIKELAGMILPASAALAGGTALQGLKGTFGTDMILDWGGSFQESRAQGKDKEEALWDATKKALVQSGIDTLTMSVAQKRLAVNRFKDMAGQMAVQAIGGASAEALKHEVVNEDYTVGSVITEGVGELMGAPLDVLAARSAAKRDDARVKSVMDLQKELQEVADRSDLKVQSERVQNIIKDLESKMAAEANEEAVPVPELGIEPTADGKTAEEQLDTVDAPSGAGQTTTYDLLTSVTVETPEGIKYLGQLDWETSPVAVAEETHYKKLLEQAQVEVDNTLAQLNHAKEQMAEQGLLEDPQGIELLQAFEDKARSAQADMETFKAARLNEQATMAKVQGIVADWVNTFAPGMKVVLSPSQVGARVHEINIQKVEDNYKMGFYHERVQNEAQKTGIEIDKETADWLAQQEYEEALKSVKDFNMKSEGNNSNGHYIKLSNGMHVIEVNLNNLADFEGGVDFSQYMETVAHEFGHALIAETYSKIGPIAQRALHRGYRKWLKRLSEAKDSKEFNEIRSGAAKATRFEAKEFSVPRSMKTYAYGMEEYVANQMSKGLGNQELVAGPLRKFYNKVLSLLRELYNSNKNYLPEQSFQDFLKLLAAQTTQKELAAAQNTSAENQSIVAEKAYNTINNILTNSEIKKAKIPGSPKVNYGEEEFRADMDKYNAVIKYGATIIQLAKMNPHIKGLQNYLGLIKSWWQDKSAKTARADERLQQWNQFKEKDRVAIGAFMQELTVKSYENGVKYDRESTMFKRLVEKHKMSDEMLALVDLIESDFAEVLLELEAVQIEDLNRTMDDDVIKAEAIQDIRRSFEEMNQRNFFPLSRFGDQFMRVVAQKDMVYEGKEYNAGDTITFETFESQREMLKRQKDFGNKSKFIVQGGLMNDTQKQFAGFPPQFLTMLKKNLLLSQEQINALPIDERERAQQQLDNFNQLVKDLAPGSSWTKHMLHRKNTPGYSTDAVRSYANYFLHFGNYVARVKYKGALLDAISEVQQSANIIGKRTGDGTKRTKIQQHMEDHFKVAMDPGNELANLRALGFLWYLGFVPKSAIVNLTQVPLVTYPHLAAKYGDAQAVAALGKATKDAGKYWLNPKAMTNGQMDMIQELINTGILDESLATELAATSEGSLLQRVVPGNILGSQKAAHMVSRMAGAGAWMFQKAEKMNRRVTALAAYDLALKQGMTHEAAVAEAREVVETTQYEYARWNRPRFSQGKKSIMFLFWQYMQNTLFFLYNDPGRMRYLAMMLLFAGVSGLPFAEDAMDLWDYVSKKLNRRFGEDFSPSHIRLSAREFIKELGMNPDLVMHGASRYSLGLSAVGDMVGLPIPNVDLSGSISMGQIIPGLHEMLSDDPFDKGLGKGSEKIGGAVVGIPLQLMRAIADDNPDTLKRFERALPSIGKHFSKAYRFASRGEETLPDGTPITKFNLDDSMHRNEIIAQALGLNVTRVADAKAPLYMTKELLKYYALRRASYTELLDYAKKTGDSKMWAKTWAEVRKFNKSLQNKGLGSMGIRPSTIRRGLKDRKKHRLMQERGLVGGKAGYEVMREVYDSYEEEEVK